jgi:hypothetical protein
MYKLNYTPTTLGVQSRKEIISGGTQTKEVEYHWSRRSKILFRYENCHYVIASKPVLGPTQPPIQCLLVVRPRE